MQRNLATTLPGAETAPAVTMLAGGVVRSLGRLWRRLSGRLPDVEVVFSPRYRLDLPGVALDSRRGEKILGYLAAEGLLGKGAVHRPSAISFQALCRVHEMAYLESLGDPKQLTRVTGLHLSDRQRDGLIDLQRSMAGGTRLAAALARRSGGIAFNVGGGLHHAFPDHGERFCLLNDVAAAIAEERYGGFDGPVLVVDCDLHDGDGTRAVFADDATVHTFSIHNASSGTDPDAVASTSVELGADVGDVAFLDALHRHLPPVVDAVRPRLAFYVAGTDVAADDSLGDWRLSGDAVFERDRWITELLRGDDADPVPLVVVLAGGYGHESWRYAARYLAWLLSGNDRPPPSSEEAILARYRALARRLQPAELTREGEDATTEADWGLTDEDLLGALGAQKRRRFLGYYSPHGAELALERTGMLERLRRLGFTHPNVDFDLDNPAGETVRVFGDAAKRELVIELRARRDRRTVPGCEMLNVEWLLLQNPRGRFSDQRPPLPGQQHPGLGMLEDATAVLILICERLGLDGLLFTPSHFHLAAQGRAYLHFLQPEHEALFEALTEAVEGLPLADATQAVDGGRVVDAVSGEPFTLPHMPMVLPLSEELAARLEDEAYLERVEAARQRYRFRLGEAAPQDAGGDKAGSDEGGGDETG